jgi:hypothetical protein
MDSIKRPSTAQRRAAGTVSLNRESPSSSIHGSHVSPFSQRDLVSQFAMGGDNGARPTSQSTDSRNIARSLDFNQNNNTKWSY